MSRQRFSIDVVALSNPGGPCWPVLMKRNKIILPMRLFRQKTEIRHFAH